LTEGELKGRKKIGGGKSGKVGVDRREKNRKLRGGGETK